MLGRKRGDIATGSGKPVDNDHHRLLALQVAQCIIKLLGTGSGSPGAINVHDDGTRPGTGKPAERLDAILVSTDQPLDLDARDVGARRRKAAAGHEQQRRTRDRGQSNHQRAHAPECELTPYPSAIDDSISIERHSSAPSVDSKIYGTCQ